VKKRGQRSDHSSHSGFALPHTYVGLFIALIMVLISILSLNDFSAQGPTAAVVVGANADGETSALNLNNVNSYDSTTAARVGSVAELSTDIAVEDIDVESATLVLANNDVVDYVYQTADFDALTYTCPDCAEEQPASLWDQYKNIVWMALMILVAIAIAVSLLIYFSKRSHPRLAKIPPGPAVPSPSQIKSMGTKGAIAPRIVEPKIKKKKEEPAPSPIDKKLLSTLYKWPVKKKSVRDPALEALEKQVKKEAKRNIKNK